MLPLGGAFARAPGGRHAARLPQRQVGLPRALQWADPAEAERNIDWMRDFDAAMAEYAEDGVYVNFVAEPTAEAVKAGFGADKYARMVEVKDEYDPDNVFRSNTNIPPSAAG